MHSCLEDVVIDAVEEDVASRTGAGEEGRPLPEVVLSIEAEVDNDDGRHAHNNHEDGVNTQKEAIYVVVLVVPERGEDIVQLNEDGTER